MQEGKAEFNSEGKAEFNLLTITSLTVQTSFLSRRAEIPLHAATTMYALYLKWRQASNCALCKCHNNFSLSKWRDGESEYLIGQIASGVHCSGNHLKMHIPHAYMIIFESDLEASGCVWLCSAFLSIF